MIALMLVVVGFAPAAFAAPMQVTVGVAPLKYFANKIGGSLVRISVLVPAGADAHTYEPKASQMRAVAASSMYISAGLEFEEAWEPRLKSAKPRLIFVETDKGLAKMPMPEGHHDHHEKKGAHEAEHEEMDPHIWVAPSQVKLIATTIANAFAKADPANAKVYSANLASFLREIAGLDAELRSTFASIPAGKRGFLVFHPAWGYLARDYGLTQHSIEFEGKEPSPKRLGQLMSESKNKGYAVVFVQPQMSRRTAQSVANAIGARLVVVDPLAEDWAANLRAVAASFRGNLK
jgi:ABC-type metal ion transport system, periplasmic component/surface adhesin